MKQCHRFTVSITSSLRERMRAIDGDTNWSKVVRDAIERELVARAKVRNGRLRVAGPGTLAKATDRRGL